MNLPDLVNRCEILPGISDHNIPVLDVSTTIVLNKTTPRKIYQYHKVNFEAVNESLTIFARNFYNKYSDHTKWTVDTMWDELKSAVQETINSHNPVKLLSSHKQQLPWINSKVKLEITKRNKLFDKVKKN